MTFIPIEVGSLISVSVKEDRCTGMELQYRTLRAVWYEYMMCIGLFMSLSKTGKMLDLPHSQPRVTARQLKVATWPLTTLSVFVLLSPIEKARGCFSSPSHLHRLAVPSGLLSTKYRQLFPRELARSVRLMSSTFTLPINVKIYARIGREGT
jgi:hypothetical protein